jgi:hypothetical protein
MATAKELDALKTKVEQKQADIGNLTVELGELQKELKNKAKEFFAEAGIELPSKSEPSKVKAEVEGTVNQEVAKELKSKLRGEKFINITKKDIQDFSDNAECSVVDVEATMSDLLTPYNPEKKRGRNVRFALK